MSKIVKLKEFLEHDPKDCFVLHALGLEYVKAGDTEQAESYFQSVLDVNPDYVGTYYHLGKVYEEMGNNDRAMDTYRMGIEVADRIEDSHAKSELDTALWELED